MNEAAYLIRLAAWLARSLGETAPILGDLTTDSVGIDLPPVVLQGPTVVTAAHQAQAGATKVRDAGAHLEIAAGASHEMQMLAPVLGTGGGLAGFFTRLGGAPQGLQAGNYPAPISHPHVPAPASHFSH